MRRFVVTALAQAVNIAAEGWLGLPEWGQFMSHRHVPVLIVEGGPIGLTGSNLLSRHGVEHLLVNRQPATSDHPRARFMDVRTLEVLRQVGLADAVIEAELRRLPMCARTVAQAVTVRPNSFPASMRASKRY